MPLPLLLSFYLIVYYILHFTMLTMSTLSTLSTSSTIWTMPLFSARSTLSTWVLKKSQEIPRNPKGPREISKYLIKRDIKGSQGISGDLKRSQGISRDLKRCQGKPWNCEMTNFKKCQERTSNASIRTNFGIVFNSSHLDWTVSGNRYESFSDVGEIRVSFASKILTPCTMHWNAFLIAQIIAKCHSFPNMYGML